MIVILEGSTVHEKMDSNSNTIAIILVANMIYLIYLPNLNSVSLFFTGIEKSLFFIRTQACIT